MKEPVQQEGRRMLADKSGLSGHLLSFMLPAIFYHPFALLFSAVETVPVHSRRDVVSGKP